MAHAHPQAESIAEQLSTYTNIVITTHMNSDGDAIGSSLGLYHALRKMKKKPTVLVPTPVPDNLMFLPGADRIETVSADHAETIFDADAIVVVDVNHKARIPGISEFLDDFHGDVIVVDHHPNPEDFAHTCWIDTDAAAAALMVYRILLCLDVQIDKKCATALYTGLMTDTGAFRFPKTNSEVHTAVAHLLDCGAVPHEIHEALYDRNPIERVYLLALALQGMEVYHNGELCIMVVSQDMMNKTETLRDHTEGFVQYTLGIDGVKMGVLIVETPDGHKASFRSKGDVAANAIAAEFGGGGHLNAAGARTTLTSAAEFVQKIVELYTP